MVRRQTEKVASIIRPRIGRVVACAPPEGRDLGWAHPITGRRMHAKRGVDLWLGEHERGARHDALLELGFYARVGEPELTADDARLLALRGADGRRPRLDGRSTAVEVVRAMGELASPVDRAAPYALQRLTDRLRRPRSRVQEG